MAPYTVAGLLLPILLLAGSGTGVLAASQQPPMVVGIAHHPDPSTAPPPIAGTVVFACGSTGYYRIGDEDICQGLRDSCFSDTLVPYPEERTGGFFPNPFNQSSDIHDWVAVIDNTGGGASTSHAYAMGGTIVELAGLHVALYDINDGSMADLGILRATDAGVLRALCELRNHLDDPDPSSRKQPPLVISMSFGREAAGDEQWPCLSGSSISCEIWRTLDYLTGLQASGVGNRTVAVAAAGNVKQSMVPAAYSMVVGIGAIDTAQFNTSGQVFPAWENPTAFHGLLPGSGVCLTGVGVAPAGSSTSAATFAAISAGLSLTEPLPSSTFRTGLWYPRIVLDGSDRFTAYLAHNEPLPQEKLRTQVPEAAAREQGQVACGGTCSYEITGNAYRTLVGTLRGVLTDPCWSQLLQVAPGEPVDLVAMDEPPFLPPMTLLEAIGDNHVNCPTPWICGACPGTQTGGPKDRSADSKAGDQLTIVLDGGEPIEGFTLYDLVLRVGTHFYRTLLDPITLNALAAGNLPSLTVSGLSREPEESVSLILVLELPDCQGPGCLAWYATPVLILDSLSTVDERRSRKVPSSRGPQESYVCAI